MTKTQMIPRDRFFQKSTCKKLKRTVIVFITTKDKGNFLKLMLLIWHFRNRTRIPNYIVKTQPCCYIDVGALRKVGDIFETFDMADHLLSRVYLGFGRITFFFCKKKTEIGKVINGKSRERSLGGADFQRGTPVSVKSSDFACLRPNEALLTRAGPGGGGG